MVILPHGNTNMNVAVNNNLKKPLQSIRLIIHHVVVVDQILKEMSHHSQLFFGPPIITKHIYVNIL